MQLLAKHRSELKFKQNIFQSRLVVLTQHNKTLKLKFITCCAPKHVLAHSSSPRKIRKLIVTVWWFVLQWITEFAVFNIVGAAILAAFLILVLGLFQIGMLLHWQGVFWETQNVHNTLQAVCPQKQPNSQHCNVIARSKSSNDRCILLTSNEAQGCYLEAKVKGWGIKKLDSVHGHWDQVTAVVSGWSQMK